MLIEAIKMLPPGTVIPKPEALADFRLKGWGVRRGEPALIYKIPNHRSLGKRLEKGITIGEFDRACAELESSGQFTRKWFNINLAAAAKEGACNYTTIGGIFSLLGLAAYKGRGEYVLISRSK